LIRLTDVKRSVFTFIINNNKKEEGPEYHVAVTYQQYNCLSNGSLTNDYSAEESKIIPMNRFHGSATSCHSVVDAVQFLRELILPSYK
jgi:hypothetical protein